ncbi:phosphatase PAP2 family protein [Stenotrophomonas sp. JAI102]|uniref:phosphatase PAP2 family protein n=1 Tax=Stenotrophomonas sp. JAI102 TaxID=2723077 RepID=UPI0015CB8F13|nr:phosphatase PAP2 family protein [Stenotrophomonas sp. JAI102]
MLPAPTVAFSSERAATGTPRFLRDHLWAPLAVTLLVSATLMGAGGDQWLADNLYQLEGHRWTLQNAWFTTHLIHQAGKWASSAAALLAIVLCTHAWRSERAAAWRWPLLYLVLAVALGTGLVSLLKSLTNMDCPWDLARYGGTREFIGLLSPRPPGMPRGVCFPGGHSSAGFAWVSLYFFARMVRPAWRWRGLAAGLLAGGVFGLSQQLRGAHFLSHDLWTLATCWAVSLGLYLLVQRIRRGERSAAVVAAPGEAT